MRWQPRDSQRHEVGRCRGAGLGLGGIITIVPDLGILSANHHADYPELSLIYGFEFNTDDEMAELWIAAASCCRRRHQSGTAGERSDQSLVPRVIQRIAAQPAGKSSKSGRTSIPFASSLIGAG